ASVRARSGSCANATLPAAVNAKAAKAAKAAKSQTLLCGLVPSPQVPSPLVPSPLKDRFPIYLTGYRQAEELQYGWRDIGNVCAVDLERPARHEGARRFLVVVRSVVARPLLHVRIHEARRRSAA